MSSAVLTLRILASSLACSPRLGSESLVGYRAIEALARRCDVALLTSAEMRGPSQVPSEVIGVRFDNPNDVSAWQLLRFELLQRRRVLQLFRKRQFDVLHRITPSGVKDTLLPLPPMPLVLGPILLSEAAPPTFREILGPRLHRPVSLQSGLHRLRHGIARRIFDKFSTLDRWLDQARLILVGTQTTLRRLPSRLHERCRTITYAGVENDVFTPANNRHPNRIPHLLFVGRVVPYKGVELLLRAAAIAKQSCRFDLTILGRAETTYLEYCTTLTKTLGLGSIVRFLDGESRTALVERYRAADIFCMPSIETYGLAILEAMSCGRAVIVSDINGPGEIVQPGTGVKVPLESPEQFITQYAESMVHLIEDQQLRSDLGHAAREHVVRFHDWKQIQARLLAIYDETFGGPNAAAFASQPSLVTSTP